MKFFDNTNNGRIINRISNDTLTIDQELPWFGHVFLENLSEAAGYPIGIMYINSYIFKDFVSMDGSNSCNWSILIL